MVTPEDIKRKALKKYGEYLKCKYCDDGKEFFPFVIKFNKNMSSFSSLDELKKGMDLLKSASKKFGYKLYEKTRYSKEFVVQDVPISITIDSELDFLKFIGMETDNKKFDMLMQKTLSEFPNLKDSLIKKHKLVVDNNDKWNDILKVCRYFNVNHKPNKFARELPIGLHTKFIEENKEILRVLLNIIVGDDVNKDAKTFYGRFNLKEGDPQISFRLLDNDFSVKFLSSLTYSTVFVCEFAKLTIPVRNVVIVENKHNMTKLIELFPEIKETIVVWGSGYKVTVLKDVPWLKDLKLYYWGDIDAQGYEILSDIRQYFPYIESIMMDEEALRIHPTKVTGTVSKVKKQLALHDYENKVYEYVKENNLRCEQEFLPESFIKDKIKQSVKSFVG